MKEYFVGKDDFVTAHERPAMISANALIRIKDGRVRTRKAPICADRWMLDSGAFSQITKYGDFIMSPAEYVRLAVRFQHCGRLACIVTQDYMCEPSVIEKIKGMGRRASVRIHQKKTVDRYIQIMDEAERQGLQVPVMPVLQGWEMEDYVQHYQMYRDALKPRHPNTDNPGIYEKRGGFYARMYNRKEFCRGGGKYADLKGHATYGRESHINWGSGLWHNPFTDKPGGHQPGWEFIRNNGQWIGLGSTCKRNRNPEAVEDILNHLEPVMGKLEWYKIHLFGFKTTGLKNSGIRDRIPSADSMAYDFHNRMIGKCRTREARTIAANKFYDKTRYQPKIQTSFDFSIDDKN